MVNPFSLPLPTPTNVSYVSDADLALDYASTYVVQDTEPGHIVHIFGTRPAVWAALNQRPANQEHGMVRYWPSIQAARACAKSMAAGDWRSFQWDTLPTSRYRRWRILTRPAVVYIRETVAEQLREYLTAKVVGLPNTPELRAHVVDLTIGWLEERIDREADARFCSDILSPRLTTSPGETPWTVEPCP